MLQHEHHRVPVTALAFSADFLLAGEGTFLRIYSRRDEELLSSTELFIGQAIHGIVIHEGSDCIIVWGGSSVRTMKILPAADDELPPVLIVSPPARAPDWILDISFRPARTEIKTDQGIEAALLTAHNALFTLKPDPLHEEAPVLTGLTSTSKCILYSAHVAWNGPNDALVASGTAFGEIIVWSCELSPTQPAEARLHQILTGHEGSIFGVKISDPILPGSEGHPSKLLATCSDDRTIRLWDISKLPQTAIDPQTAANAITARETGFGANLEGLVLGETTTSSCIAKGWGHLSRIWDVKFIPSCTQGVLLHLVSFGEDATCQYWDLLSPEDNSEGNSHAYKLLHQGSSALHAGKNIWASAITATTDGRVTVATGAADGSVALRTKAISFQPPESRTQEWSIEQLVAAAAQSGASRDKLRGYAYSGNGQLLVVTDTGSILKLRTAVEDARGDEDHTQCECIAQEDSLRGYSVVTSLPSHSIAFMAGIQGAILFYHPRTGIRELANYKGKVAALFPQYHEDPSTRRETITLLATTVEAGRALLFTIALPLSSSSKLEVTQMALNLPTGFVVTGFTMICADSGNRQRIVLGARDGSLAVFEAQKGADLVEQQAWVCNQLLRGAHGRDAVTALAWVQGPTNHLGWIFSAGRDGSLTVHEAALGQDTPQLLLVHRADLPLGNNLEGLFVDADTGRLLVWGFRSKHFALYDVIAERELMAVDCGGANRTWSFHLASDCNGGALAWTKASKLLTTDLKGWNDRVIHGGGHGREIKEVAISPFIGEDSSQLIATGAEDTDIKLSEYTRDPSGQGQFRCVRTLRKHNTGIQHLQWSEDGNYLFSSGGFEEFYVWRIRRVPVLGVAVVCASACPPESELPDLRIMSFSATRAKQLESGDTATARFLITMVYSDSTTKTFLYSPLQASSPWTLLYAGNYLTSCLTQALHLETDNVTALVTAATEGHLGVWPVHEFADAADPAVLKWTKRQKVHQNAVHCMEAYDLAPNDWLLMTSGDDNGVGITRLHWRGAAGEAAECSSLLIPRAHAAAVTALAVIALPGQTERFWLATAGIDQRLKLWEIRIKMDEPGVSGIEVKRLANVFTPVADVSSMALIGSSETGCGVLVCGVGMDLWRLRSS